MRVGALLAFVAALLGTAPACTSVEVACTAGAQTACACPDKTQGVQICGADGSSGACSCSSSSSGGTPCAPGAQSACYSGPLGTEGIGTCKAGVQTCNPDGLSYGACVGEVQPKPENCDTLEDESCDGTPGPCGGLTLWSKSFGDIGDDVVAAMASDAQGNLVITGHFHGTIDFGGGPLSAGPARGIFVAGFDGTGKHLWSKAFPGGVSAAGRGIARDPSGDIVLAANCDSDIDFGGGPLLGSSGDLCLVKFDAAGGHVWSHRFKNGGPTALAVDPVGNILLAGLLNGDLGGGTITEPGSFVAKLDPMAKFLWARQGLPYCQSLATDASGDVFLTAQGGSDLAFGGTKNAGPGAVVVKLSGATGAHVYSSVFALQSIYPTAVAVDPQGDMLATGYFSSSGDFGGVSLTALNQSTGYLVKFDPGGNTLFAKALGDKTGYAQGLTVAAGPSGDMAIAGLVFGSFDFGNGAIGSGLYVAKLLPSGSEKWAHAYASADWKGNLRPFVAVDEQGGVIVAGSFSDKLDLGKGVLASSSISDSDLFIARLGP